MGFRTGHARSRRDGRAPRRGTATPPQCDPEIPYLPGVRAVLFDLDNTLVSHPRDLAVVALAFLMAHVAPASWARRWGIRALLALLLAAGIRRLAVLSHGARIVLPLLDEAGIPFGVLTNGSSYKRTTVRALGLDRHTRCVIVSADYGVQKPNARIFRHAARCLGVRPARVLMVGDKRDSDIQGACRAGMRTAWLQRGLSRLLHRRAPQATVTIDSLAQLRRVLGLEARSAAPSHARRSV